MSTSNKTIVARLYNEISRGNLNVIEELLAAEYMEHAVMPGLSPHRAGVRQLFEGMRAGFPDCEIVAEDMIAEGDKVLVRATMPGTHRGVFMDIPATGKNVSVPVADFFRIGPGEGSRALGCQ
jgi:predicted ester cyclase